MNVIMLFKLDSKKYFIEVPKSALEFVDKKLLALIKFADFLYFNDQIKKTRFNKFESEFVLFELIQNYSAKSDVIKEIKLEHIDFNHIRDLTYCDSIKYIESI